MKCPHCSKPLIIRAYFEEYHDCEVEELDGFPTVGAIARFSQSGDSDYTDYECATCKENVTFILDEKIEDLKKSHPQMFA